LVGFTRSYITEIETGERNISYLNLLKVIEVLGVESVDLQRFFDETKIMTVVGK